MCGWKYNFKRTCKCASLAVALLLCSVSAHSPSNHAQEKPQPSAGSQTDSSHNEVLRKEDIDVMAAYIILDDLLPPGAHIGSGFRSKEDQISIIRKFAIGAGISPLPSMTDIEGWNRVTDQLRAMGFIVADPTRTPHSSTDRIVLDIGGADLGKIKQACVVAQNMGLIAITNLIVETKKEQRAIHVELNITRAGMAQLGFHGSFPRRPSDPETSPQTSTADSSEDMESRKALMQNLISLHNKERSMAKKIDYDNQRIDLLNLINPFDQTGIQALQNEIKEHEEALKRDEGNQAKQQILDELRDAQAQGRLDEAELVAKKLVDKFPEEKPVLEQIMAWRLVNEAINQLLNSDCSNCKDAKNKIDEALKLSSSDPRALRIQGEIQVCLSQCKSKFIGLIVLIVLTAGGIGVGLFFWLRPKRWMLVGIEGPCKGQVFPLYKPETVIGALDSSEEEDAAADIVISDPHHRISRFHCLIRQLGRHLYLRDTSSNGTWINHKKLDRNTEERLFHGAEISLADEAMLVLKVDRSKRSSN